MGCDIHSVVELYDETTNSWRVVHDLVADEYTKAYYKRDTTCEFYEGRSYFLFALLAGVRKYDVEKISKPRGIPENASKEYLDLVERWDGDGHSHSWVTLDELLNYDYSKMYYGYEGETLTYEECLPDAYFNRLEELKKKGDPKNIRIAFFFDN